MYMRQSNGIGGFGESATTITSPPYREGGAQCSATERRITPIQDPDAANVANVDPRYTGGARGLQLERQTYDAYLRLKAAAEADGIAANLLTVTSGYRSRATQERLFAAAVQKYGSREAARKWVAPPGGSAHQTGRAIDFNLGLGNNSENVAALRRTAPYRWLVCNAHRFGFTPYSAEPWHWEFHPGTGSGGTAPAPAPTPAQSAAAGAAAAAAAAAAAGAMRSAGRAIANAAARAARMATGGGSTFSAAEDKAFRITALFEGGIGGVSGNFDGMGLSLGALQWNIGSGSLQPLLLEFIRTQRAAFDAIFGNDAAGLVALLATPRPNQVAFFDRISTQPSKARLVEPWQSRFRQLATHPAFVTIQMSSARDRMNRAYHFMRRYNLSTERALVFMFDMVVAHGGAWDGVRRQGKLRREIVAERKDAEERRLGRALSTNELLTVIARVISDTVLPRWSNNVLCRRELIIRGVLPASMSCGRYNQMNLATTFSLSDATIPVPPARP
jgi:hypothetical protein